MKAMNKAIKSVKKAMNNASSRTENLVEAVKERFSTAEDAAKERYADVAEAAKERYSNAAEKAEDAASTVRASWADGIRAVADLVMLLRRYDRNDLLKLVGLRRNERRPLLGAGLFGAGLAVGMGAGMLLAPDSGQESRRRLRARFSSAMKEARSTVEIKTEEVKEAMKEGAKKMDTLTHELKDAAKDGVKKAEGVGHDVKDAVKAAADYAQGVVSQGAKKM